MEKIRAGVGEHVAMTSYLAGTVVCGGGLALVYGWQLTLAGLSVVPAALLVAWVVSRRQTRCHAQEVAAYSVAGRLVEDALASIRTVRAYAGEEVEAARYALALRGAGRAARARGLWAGAGSGLGWFLTYSLNAIVFAYGAALCVRDMGEPPESQEYHPGIMVTVSHAPLHSSFLLLSRIRLFNRSLFFVGLVLHLHGGPEYNDVPAAPGDLLGGARRSQVRLQTARAQVEHRRVRAAWCQAA